MTSAPKGFAPPGKLLACGHGHHLHSGKTVRRYALRGVKRLLADFWNPVAIR